MSDSFLTSVLEIVIVVDLLGVIAYFVLALLKPRHRPMESPSPAPSSTPPYSLWGRLIAATGLGSLARKKRTSSDRPLARESLEVAFGDLRRVLFGYEKGLA